ncbi:MAG TPA: hypothetical protein VLL54_12200 [Pyrinomonadaceae bacterium]|nr:hypothetical protein [Pyrinomonadaceae bacterium]
MKLRQNNSRTFRKLTVLGALVLACVAFVFAERSRGQLRPARVISLKPGDDLQAAIRGAKFGDTIVLPAGATFVGPIVLPFKGATSGSDADYITIRTSDLAGIAAEGDRIKPASHARAMVKIVAPQEKAAVITESRAHHYKFIGVEFAPASDANYVFNVIDLGSGDYSSQSQFPHHLIFDRCYVHSTGMNRARRGFALNSAETSLINSYVSGFAGAGDETQAIAAWNTPGPLHIINNFLEGAGEVVLIGGADPRVPNLVPSDIEIRNNYLRKPREWSGRATVKGTFELKNARRVVIEGNLIESELLTTAIVLTVRNQGGKAPWSTIEDVDVRNNIVRHASTGVNILGSDNEQRSQEASRIRVTNNLFVDLVANDPNNIPYFLQTNGGSNISVAHNTVQQAGNVITAYGTPVRNFVFRDNIVQFNRYGIVCQIDGQGCGDAFCGCYPAGMVRGNVFIDNLGVGLSENLDAKYPDGNFFVSSYQKAGITDLAHGNWRLAVPNGTQRKASDGRNPGVDFDALIAAGAIAAREGTTSKSYVR